MPITEMKEKIARATGWDLNDILIDDVYGIGTLQYFHHTGMQWEEIDPLKMETLLNLHLTIVD